MSILYKLVGVTNTRNNCTELLHKDWDESKKNFTLKDAKEYFKSMGMTDSQVDQIKFISNAEIITDEKNYDLSTNKLTIYVFSQVEEIKKQIFKVFQDNGKVSINQPVQEKKEDTTISKPLSENLIKITPEIIEESNQTTVELFKNKNFQTLLRIFYEDPSVYKRFASFVVSGDMVEDPFSEETEDEFDKEAEHLVSLGIPIPEDDIRTALKKFNGHINLTLRYLLTMDSLI